MTEACVEFVIVVCTLLIGDLVFWIAERMRLRRVEKIRKQVNWRNAA